jgi:hypothetical protein
MIECRIQWIHYREIFITESKSYCTNYVVTPNNNESGLKPDSWLPCPRFLEAKKYDNVWKIWKSMRKYDKVRENMIK